MKEPHLLLSWRDLNLMNTYLKSADIRHGRRNMPELNFTRFLLENCQWYDFTLSLIHTSLLDYFPDDFLMIIDESHVTLPQIRGMYRGDRARKETLVQYGFRLPSAYDNRPLKFDEFEDRINQVVFVSATPGSYELERSSSMAEQIIRPTGLVLSLIHI